MECIIVLTYRCNAHCHMCNTWKYPSTEEEEITSADLHKLPDGMKFANITGGEPFLRSDIQQAVRIVKSKTKRLVISTNGYYTDEILDVAQNNRDIGFRISLEGLSAANDELRGVKHGFDHGLRTLLALHEMGIKDIGFGITLSDRNAKDLMELYSLAKWLGVEFSTAAVHNSYYFHKFDNAITDCITVKSELKKLIERQLRGTNVKSWFRGYFNYGLINYIDGKERLLPCAMGFDVFLLDPFGEIRPCNGMEASMGNLKQHTFAEIWQSSDAEKVRQQVLKCRQNCWMVGSAAPAMKKQITKPIGWIVKNKLGRREL
jgi:Fe-coproporphyrin III synthase